MRGNFFFSYGQQQPIFENGTTGNDTTFVILQLNVQVIVWPVTQP